MTLETDSATDRHGFPLLHAGQAQKEIFHNEALVALDHIIMPVVETVADDPDSLTPEAGQSWLVSSSAPGAWAGEAGKIASWTINGWRIWEPKPGTYVFDRQADCFRIYQGSSWFVPLALSAPTGGTVIDVEARDMLVSIMEILRNFRLIPANI